MPLFLSIILDKVPGISAILQIQPSSSETTSLATGILLQSTGTCKTFDSAIT